MSKIWNECLKTLKKNLDLQDFTLLVKPITAIEKGQNLVLYTPNKQSFTQINKKIAKTISSAIHANHKDTNVVLKVKSAKATKPWITNTLLPEFSFKNLVVGSTNKMAQAAAQQIANNIKKSQYNPFIIYGASGLGKTHLLQAAGLFAKEKDPTTKVIFTTLMDFVKNITRSIQHNKIEELKLFYQSADLLLVDDIHLISGKTKSQEEFFHIFNFLFSNKIQIILTCDELPGNISGIEPRIISRFNSGLNLEIEPPELEMRAAILLNKAKKLGGLDDLDENHALYIATKITKNVRELEGALLKLKATIEFNNENIKINQEFIDTTLKDLFQIKSNTITIHDIQKVVAKYYNTTVSDILSKKRTKGIVLARQIAMHLSKNLTTNSLLKIGKEFGNKDHTTVIHATKKIQTSITTDNEVKQDYNNIKLILTTNNH
jgi:chromosomal replication initiator protein